MKNKNMDKVLEKKAKNDKNLLTDREKDVLLLVTRGYTNKEIAQELFLTEFTIKSHLLNIFKKLNVKNRTKATLVAMQMDLEHK